MEYSSKICFYIPAQNNVDEIDMTIESIRKQEYPRELVSIRVMDFGSEDGTYEKLLKLDGYHLGVYRVEKTGNPREMLNRIAGIKKYEYLCMDELYSVLYPGDLLKPQFLETCIKAYTDNHTKAECIVCEADIIGADNEIIRQNPLYDDPFMNIERNRYMEYVNKGYDHQVQCITTYISDELLRSASEYNEQRWWNKMYWVVKDKDVLYIGEPLVCQKRVRYEDETEEILLRWESIISRNRLFESMYGVKLAEQYIATSLDAVARYALWRAEELTRENEIVQAENCRMLAGIISEGIKSAGA